MVKKKKIVIVLILNHNFKLTKLKKPRRVINTCAQLLLKPSIQINVEGHLSHLRYFLKIIC